MMLLLVACAPPLASSPAEGFEEARIALGEQLFFEAELSADGSMSCATCHDPALAFSDGRAVPVGVTGEALPRNALGLYNVGLLGEHGWAHPGMDDLAAQAFVPLYADAPPELGATPELVVDAIDPELHEAAFGAVPPTAEHARLALRAFQESLVSDDAPWDRWVSGEPTLSAEAERGAARFEAACASCHAGPLFTIADAAFDDPDPFRDNGLLDDDDPGLYVVTGADEDRGRFRVPSLRNLSYTAPYMHDGRFATLDEVLDHYDASLPLDLGDDGRAELLAFLVALDDPAAIAWPP